MALFKSISGDSTDLEEIEKTPGHAYFTQGDNKFHVDVGNKRQTLDAEGSDGVYLKQGDEYLHIPGDRNEKGVLIPGRQLLSSYYEVTLLKDSWKNQNGEFIYLFDNLFEKRRDNTLIPPIVSPISNTAEYFKIKGATIKDGSEEGLIAMEFIAGDKLNNDITLAILVV